MDHRKIVVQLTRYGITGAAGLVLNLILLGILIDVIGTDESVAALYSAGFALFVTFVSTERWVFTAYSQSNNSVFWRRAPMYYVVMSAGKAVNYVIYVVLLSANVWYPVAWMSGSILVFGITFLLNRLIWKRTEIDRT
jgi:putative flippase GtrA